MNQQTRFDALIVFGYGPVRPSSTPGCGTLNLYGRINAIAAGVLFRTCEVRTIIPTGGRTGGPDRPSEAALISRILQTKFGVPEHLILPEGQSLDTLFNVAHVANLIDRSPVMWRALGFVAMGCHLPRIREICSLIGLDGEFIPAEDVVRKRSARYDLLLQKLLRPEIDGYARMIEDQRRGFRGLREMPEYWLPPMSVIESFDRLQHVLKAERVQPFLQRHGIDLDSASAEELRAWLGSIPRQFPV